jgi:uncharacterized protein YnzC (UPF0291/DUF896 family)
VLGGLGIWELGEGCVEEGALVKGEGGHFGSEEEVKLGERYYHYVDTCSDRVCYHPFHQIVVLTRDRKSNKLTEEEIKFRVRVVHLMLEDAKKWAEQQATQLKVIDEKIEA